MWVSPASVFLSMGGRVNELVDDSVEGALDVWIDSLLDALVKLYPLDEGTQMIPADTLHPPRATIVNAPKASPVVFSPLHEIDPDTTYYRAAVRCNNRITAQDWFQDVRHIEFDFKEDIR
jgi:sulfite reductase alpha subunit-like flavoprotein